MATRTYGSPAAAGLPFIHPDDVPDLYSIEGRGQCMAPLIEDRAQLVFDKRQPPEPGDLVGIFFTRAAAEVWRLPGLVKRLSFELPPPSGGMIVVEQVNPPRRYVIPSTDVLAVHKCVGIGEPNGDGTVRFSPRSAEAWA